jgi:putative nucleotidyltransferase with HDIG domain
VKQHIRLRGISDPIKGKVWESSTELRVGRLATLEVFLDDGSVSRRHAEVRATKNGWRVRDCGSTNGTFLNGRRLNAVEEPLRARDILRCGELTLVVDEIHEGNTAATNPESDELVVQATARASFEEALSALVSLPGSTTRGTRSRPGDPLLVLLRAGHHLGHHESEQELLDSILNDAVRALDAQRGAIVLADGPNGALRLRALATGSRREAPARPSYSQNLALRSFQGGESILCRRVDEDPELALAQSIAEGAMASVVCALLRTPRKRLGVLHLDRSPWQPPFTTDDLSLADALAANVSAGIEAAQLLRKQRDLFLKTISILGQAIELRDTRTGGHTARVTDYSLLLAGEVGLPAEEVELVRIGTPLHDIGKIGIRDDILQKPGRLTPEEFEEMKTHTVKGAEILATIPDLTGVIPIVRSHHERWDGRGYPDGLAGEEIPRIARIVAVADAFDAMTSNRPYRDGMPLEAAFHEVQAHSGKQFDPEVAAALLALRGHIAENYLPKTARLAMSDVTAMLTR